MHYSYIQYKIANCVRLISLILIIDSRYPSFSARRGPVVHFVDLVTSDLVARTELTGDTRKIFVSKTVDESHSARVLIGCKPIRTEKHYQLLAARRGLVVSSASLYNQSHISTIKILICNDNHLVC